jgi:hypothetical protein
MPILDEEMIKSRVVSGNHVQVNEGGVRGDGKGEEA